MNPLRIGFAGTPEFAAHILRQLIACGRTPHVVYTQPDRPVGRGRKVRVGPVRQVAEAAGLPVLQPESLKGAEAAATLEAFALDVLIVAAYGLLLPPSILVAPRLGCINVHASLLPRWRGAAPVERAIMAGDAETGVSIMQMDAGLDTGPVYLMRPHPIGPRTTGPELEQALATLGSAALLDCLGQLPGLTPVAQPEDGALYARKLTTLDACIDWSRPAVVIDRQVRALCGRMPAYTFTSDARLQVLSAEAIDTGPVETAPGTLISADPKSGLIVACGVGALSISRLQLNRGKGLPLDAKQALNGFPALLAQGLTLHAEPR